jgi:hypothetical protein
MSKTFQKIVKRLQKLTKIGQKIVKKLSTNCQTFVKHLSKFCYIGKGSGEEEESEEDWWLQDQVATSSHLVKTD